VPPPPVITPPTVTPVSPTDGGPTTLVSGPPSTRTSTVLVGALTVPPLGPVVTTNSPASTSDFAPQLALALSEGPLGGSFGSTTNAAPAGTTASSTTTGTVLAVLATPVIPPSALNGGADATEGDAGSTAAADLAGASADRVVVASAAPLGFFASAAAANAIAATDALWMLNQPAQWIDGLLHTSGLALRGWDRWLAQTGPQLKPFETSVALGQVNEAPTQTVSSSDEPSADGAGAPLAVVASGGPFSSGQFWWGATAFLCVVWGALNGHKWLAARRTRQDQAPTLKPDG
jgi:hypothetical protein